MEEDRVRRVVVAQTAHSWERIAAEEVVAALAAAITENGRATVALAGGNTPRPVYHRLASRLRKKVAWDKVEIFFGDERCVAPESDESNFHMAYESLIEPLGLDAGKVHRIEGERDPEEAARRYAAELEAVVGDPPRFDLVLLGLGEDGHTASLFPATPDLAPEGRWVFPTEAPVVPRHRLSLSLSVLNLARR
ncbi:MAG TPA: 6-phosphogluconolactonase, partial [Thermoanaerobaculia bacterium]|nr:6-phosphogluconolactonase [Thermoanaerobaculia bacterium]